MRLDAAGWWLREAPPPCLPAPGLAARRSFDVVVIGGGYTGMWTAWYLMALAPGASVALIEAGRCGEGPSGRNGGFVNAMWASAPTLIEQLGRVDARSVALLARDSVAAIGEWCEAEGVDAWFRAAGYLEVSAAPAQDAVARRQIDACAELGQPEAAICLEPQSVRARCASPVFRGGVLFGDGASVQPARLARGLRERIISAGVSVAENTSARVAQTPAGLVVDASGERIRAGAVVLAIGGATVTEPGFRRALTNTSSHIVITEPVPDLLEQIGWVGGEAITDARSMVHYFRTTPDGRIAFGWGGGPIAYGARIGGRAERDRKQAAAVEQHLYRFFPALRGRTIEHAWGGPIDVSPSHLPVIRSVGPNLFAGFGYTGHGVGPSRMVARSLASLALVRRDQAARLPLIDLAARPLPPEPLRWIGGTVIRGAIVRQERLQEEGRSVDRLTRAICAIPAKIGVRIGR